MLQDQVCNMSKAVDLRHPSVIFHVAGTWADAGQVEDSFIIGFTRSAPRCAEVKLVYLEAQPALLGPGSTNEGRWPQCAVVFLPICWFLWS